MAGLKPDNQIDALVEAGIIVAASIMYTETIRGGGHWTAEEAVTLARRMAVAYREMSRKDATA